MPEFVHVSGIYVPMSGAGFTFNTLANVAVPSGNLVSDVEQRLISDTLTTLNTEVQMIPASGFLIVASGGQWKGLSFNG
jgi:hypothetical protein